jgi:hypothetical protein
MFSRSLLFVAVLFFVSSELVDAAQVNKIELDLHDYIDPENPIFSLLTGDNHPRVYNPDSDKSFMDSFNEDKLRPASYYMAFENNFLAGKLSLENRDNQLSFLHECFHGGRCRSRVFNFKNNFFIALWEFTHRDMIKQGLLNEPFKHGAEVLKRLEEDTENKKRWRFMIVRLIKLDRRVADLPGVSDFLGKYNPIVQDRNSAKRKNEDFFAKIYGIKKPNHDDTK